MKLIFLDVDGVLNHSKSPGWKSGDHRVLDDTCVVNLKKIIETTGAQIVLTSTWRLNPEAMKMLTKKIGNQHFVGRTPWLQGNSPRKLEILEWLYKIFPYCYNWNDDTPIKEMVVIDDDEDANLGEGSFFKTSFEHGGLTIEIARRIIEHFNK